MTQFPISGVEIHWWLPVVVAFVIACFSSTGGVSGAFLILPFQVSVLGFSGPGASATNLLYNIIAIPSGVYRYWRERRIVWPLAVILIVGMVPGTFLGAWLRVRYLAGEAPFKIFAGLVLLYIGGRLAADFLRSRSRPTSPGPGGEFRVAVRAFHWRRIEYDFDGRTYGTTVWKLFLVLLVFGVVAGAYGIGGGALTAPLLVAVFGLPVHTIAGATLLATFVSSICGVGFYALFAQVGASATPVSPDWLLGLLFGVGGSAGLYVGARLQRHVPAPAIKAILLVMTLFIALSYLAKTLF